MHLMSAEEERERAKAAFRGSIHTIGIEAAAEMVADHYTVDNGHREYDSLTGIILAAYEAGKLQGLTQ